MRKFTLILFALVAMVGSVSAKTFETTLWEGTSSDNAEINISASKFNDAKSGDIIRITFSFTTKGSMHLCYKTGKDGDWNAKAFDGITQWPYFEDTSVTSTTATINDTDLATLKTYGMYVYGFTTCTITKIVLTGEMTPSATSDNLLGESWESSKETAKIFSAVSGAKIGDVLRFTVSTANAWDWVQFKLTDKDGAVGQFTGDGSELQGNNSATTFTFEFIIANLGDLKKIEKDGFGVIQTGNNVFTLTDVRHLTYSDSYGYVTITIGDTGYATWSSAEKYDFKSAGLQAYYASAVASGSVTLTPMDITWDWQGYIIKGEKGDYDVMQSLTTDGTYYPSTNYLRQNVNEGTVYRSAYTGYDGGGDNESNIKNKYRYIFAKKKKNDTGKVGFYKLTADHTLGAHKAYLETDTDITPKGGAQVALIFDDGETTSIDAINTQHPTSNTQCYNLAGQKVSDSYKGIVIKNGKKYINK